MLERELNSFIKWTEIPEDQRKIVLQELENTEPRMGFDELELRLKEKSNLKIEEIQSIIRSMISIFLNYYETDKPVDEFIEEIIMKFERIDTEINKEEISNFVNQILKLEHNLGIMTKAISVMTDHAHIFNRSRILTDLRPIFRRDIQESPKNAVIIHNLKILYRQDGKSNDFFVAMDSKDLSELKNVIERAQTKEKSLKQLCSLKEIKLLEVM